MVTVVTGVFEVFGTAAFRPRPSSARRSRTGRSRPCSGSTLQSASRSSLLCLVAAPLLNMLYQDPNTGLVLVALAPNFVFNAAGVQHVALLQRQLRYTTLSSIEVGSELVSGAISIGLALAGWSYWALVVGVLAGPLVITVGAWIATGWIPGLPSRDRAVSSMLRFGGTITLNGLIVYVAYNLEKLLLGRYFGPDALGLYGRAYELINLPTRILNSAVGSVAFSALSRLQTDAERIRKYFLAGYSLVVSLTLPTTIVCAVLADDIILVVLGPKWQASAQIFRLLAPTILVFGMINPLGWLLQSSGLQERSLKVALALCPVVICSYLIGIPYGPTGVALAYSVAMTLWLVPHILWCLHETPDHAWRPAFGYRPSFARGDRGGARRASRSASGGRRSLGVPAPCADGNDYGRRLRDNALLRHGTKGFVCRALAGPEEHGLMNKTNITTVRRDGRNCNSFDLHQ